MTHLEIATRLLQAVPHDCYCESCLASALQLPPSLTADVAAALARCVSYERHESTCVACGRCALTIVYVPIKCARCSRTIDEPDLVTARGDRFHLTAGRLSNLPSGWPTHVRWRGCRTSWFSAASSV